MEKNISTRKDKKILEYITEKFGKKNGEEFVYLSSKLPTRLEQYDKKPVIILPPFDSVADNLERELAQKVIETFELQERALTKKEKEAIERAVKASIRAAKKMKKLLENRPVWDYKALADAQARLYEQPHLLAREAADILGIDPLEYFQDEILEFAKLFPKVVKPEKTHSDLWYEFLKKKGIRPEELKPKRTKQTSKKSRKSSKELNDGIPEDAKLEVLSILQALEFADYSESAKEKALQKLSERIGERSRKDPTRENLLRLGLYAYAIELIVRNHWEKVDKLREL